MKKLGVFILVIVGLIAFGYSQLGQLDIQIFDDAPEAQTVNEETLEEFELEYYSDSNEGLLFALIPENHSMDVFNNVNLTPLEDFSLENSLILAMNAGYFLENKGHAGLLNIKGNILGTLAPNDKQLSHVVELSTNQIVFSPASSFDTTGLNSSATYFQTGPLILDENEIQNDFIDTSLNGNGKYLRSILGYTSDGQRFFVITTKRYALKDLAEKLMDLDVFGDVKISAVNLDGGSSVGIFSGENARFQYGEAKRLPFVIGVK